MSALTSGVLLVEDQTAVREAIASEFEPDPAFELVGQAASPAEAREMLERADVAILDPILQWHLKARSGRRPAGAESSAARQAPNHSAAPSR
jgi:DNA-binding NarL/FixJ family response regulator